MKSKRIGFTLIELLIVVCIVGILAMIALPSYQDQVRKSRRYDATSTLLNIVLAEEQYRMKNLTYGTLSNVWGSVTTSPNGHYNLTITENTASGYTVTATPVTGDNQAKDKQNGLPCGTLTVTVSGLLTTKAPAACWS